MPGSDILSAVSAAWWTESKVGEHVSTSAVAMVIQRRCWQNSGFVLLRPSTQPYPTLAKTFQELWRRLASSIAVQEFWDGWCKSNPSD